MSLAGKGFLVTGGAGSIGGAVCRDIISKGGYAIVLDIIAAEAGAAKAKEYHADRAFYYQVDITDETKVQSACDYALSVLPQRALWGVVHCAAIAPGRKWSHKLRDSLPTFQKVMHVNTYGTFVVNACVADAINSQYPDDGPFAPRVKEERGVIINIASVVAKPVPARCLTYGTSKAAVLGLSGALADFLGPFGIRVNTVSPAVVQSALMGPDRIPYFEKELEAGAIFPHRLTLPEEIASAVTFLLTHPMLNDMDLRVDSGWRNCSNWSGSVDPRKNAISLE